MVPIIRISKEIKGSTAKGNLGRRLCTLKDFFEALEVAVMEDSDDPHFSGSIQEDSDSDQDDLGIGIKPRLGLKQTGVESEPTEASQKSQPDSGGGLRHLKEMSSALGLDTFKEKSARRKDRKRRAKDRKKQKRAAAVSVAPKSNNDSEDGLIQTEASKRLGLTWVEVVMHTDRKNKKRKTDEAGKDSDVTTEVTMKQARFEVFKFGVSGLDKESRMDAEVANLVRLGAKPPKAQRMDYAELKEVRKAEREKERERKQLERISGVRGLLGRNKGGAAAGGGGKDWKKKGRGGESLQNKVGKFDGGMLKLSAKDVAKIKEKK